MCKNCKNFDRSKKLNHIPFIYFRLALVDSVLLLDMLIEKTIIPYYTSLSPIEPEWYKISYPYFWHPFKGIIATVTIYLMVAISAERYRAVCYPLSRRHVSVNIRVYDSVADKERNTFSSFK